jgi:hypothetical protein
MRMPLFFAIFIPLIAIIVTTLLISFMEKQGKTVSIKYIYPALGLGIIVFLLVVFI